MNKTKVVVLMGGYSTEYEVSISSGNEVIKNLDKEKYEAVPQIISNEPNGLEIINQTWVDEIKPDVVFIAIHGRFGEDGSIQKILDDLKVKYIGCGVEASKIGIDKYAFKKLMDENNLKTPKWVSLKKGEVLNLDQIKALGNKWVVKPVDQGSSVGVTIVKEEGDLESALNDAFRYSDLAIIEEYISGIEVSCGVIGNTELQALPVIEICPKNEFFDYEAKYTNDRCEEIVPARIDEKISEEIKNNSIKVYQLVGARGFSRVDFIIQEGVPYVLEINTIPGLTPASLLPKEASAAGIKYSELLDKIINFALQN